MGFGKEGKGAIITEKDVITLAALANAVAIKQANPLAITDDFRILKSEYSISLTNLGAVDDLPIDIYMVNNDINVAGIAGAITAQGPLNKSDRNLAELAERGVFLLGTFSANDQIPVVGGTYSLLGPKGQRGVVEKNVRWTFTKGVGWSLAAFNASGGVLATGAVVRFSAKHFGVWVG